MAGLRNNKSQNAHWPDYVGGILRGEQPINQLVPTHCYLKDVAGLEEFQSVKTKDIMILTIPEAMRLLYDKSLSVANDAYKKTSSYYYSHSRRQIVTDILDINNNASKKGVNLVTLFDTKVFLDFSWKVMSYYDQAQNISVRISNFYKVKAITYIVNGQTYIKITGYSGLRRILNGSRYLFEHPQMLTFGIGKAAMVKGIVKGTKYNVWLSGATHALEFIFRSEYDIVDFFVDISMDIAKIMVAEIVLKAVAGLLVYAGFPVIITAFIIIAVGVYIARKLYELDSVLHLSDILKNAIRYGYVKHTEKLMRDAKELSPWQFSVLHTPSYP